jgi:hypothetical protein
LHLEDSGRKLHVVLAGVVEGIDDGDQAVLDPRLGVDPIAEAIVVELPPELDQVEGVPEVVVLRDGDVLVKPVDLLFDLVTKL